MSKAPQQQVVEVPPSGRFRWTIENFSWLESSQDKIYSDNFMVGPHKWRVMLSFPEAGMDDYISICLDVADAADLPNGWSRSAQFSLAVVNQTHDYIMKKGTVHQFNAGESNSGFISFMPLNELNDPRKGYLVDDTCIVEAEVAICKDVNSSTKEDSQPKPSQPVELSLPSKFIWRIENFSKLDAVREHCSDFFMAGGCRWKIVVYPKGMHEELNYLSLYLYAEDSAYAEFTMTVLVNELGGTAKPVRKDAECQIPRRRILGFPRFIPLSVLKDPANGYLANDACTIKIEISASKMKELLSSASTNDKACLAKEPVKVVAPVIQSDLALTVEGASRWIKEALKVSTKQTEEKGKYP